MGKINKVIGKAMTVVNIRKSSKINILEIGRVDIKVVIIAIIAMVAVVGLGIILSNSQRIKQNSQPSKTALDNLVGKALPNIQLFDKDGRPYSLTGLRGRNTVLFFNEGIMCYPACWDQVAALGTDRRFNNAETAALSVVTDSPRQWQTAQAKMPDLAKAILLFDQGSAASKQMGLLDLPSSMHAGSMPGHTYIVLDKQGIVRYVYDDPSMANNNDKLAGEISKFSRGGK